MAQNTLDLTFTKVSESEATVNVAGNGVDAAEITANVTANVAWKTLTANNETFPNASILCPDRNTSLMTAGNEGVFTITLNNVPEGYSFKNITFTSAAINGVGAFQADAVNAQPVNFTLKQGETVLGTAENVLIKVNSAAGEAVTVPFEIAEAYTATDGTLELTLTLSVTESKGCFYGLTKISIETEVAEAPAVETLVLASYDRNPLETAINGQYKLQGVKLNFNEVVAKYTAELSGEYGQILDAEGNEVAVLDKCMGGNGSSNTFATPYSSTAIETAGTYKVVVKPGVILSADGTKAYEGGEFEFTVAKRDAVVSPSAEDGFCWNETFESVEDFKEFTIKIQYASEVTLNAEKKVTMTTGETVYEATVTLEEVNATTKNIKITFDGEFAEGKYSIAVPAGLFTVDGVENAEYVESTFTYKKPQLTIVASYTDWATTVTEAYELPTEGYIDIKNATTIEVDETKVITMTIGETTYNATLSVDYENGCWISFAFEDFWAEGFEFAKGEYIFTVPAGLYTANGIANEEVVMTITYSDPQPIKIVSITPAEGEVESISEITITFNQAFYVGDELAYEIIKDGYALQMGSALGAKNTVTYYVVALDADGYVSGEDMTITEPGTYTLNKSDLSEYINWAEDQQESYTWTIAGSTVEPEGVNVTIYHITAKDTNRGALYATAESTHLTHCGASSSYSAYGYHNIDIAANAEDVNQQFVFVEYDGVTYMYSLGAKKFAVKEDKFIKLTENPEGFVTVENSDVDGYKLIMFNGVNRLNFSGGYAHGCVANYETPDDGNRLLLTEAGTYDATELVASIEAYIKAEAEALAAARAAFDAAYAQAGEILAEAGLNVTETEVALQTTDNTAAFYLWSNVPDPEEGSIDALVDNTTTNGEFFHSSWHSSVTADMHYLEVDLGEGNELAEFTFGYHTRVFDGGNDFPVGIQVMGSNDGENYTEVYNVTSGLPQAGDKSWKSDIVSSETAYRYFRFNVTAERTYWHMSEFDIITSNITVAEKYAAVAKAVVALNNAYAAAENNAEYDTEALNAATAAFNAALEEIEAGVVEPVAPLTVVAVTPSEPTESLKIITIEFSEEIAGTQDLMAMETIYVGSQRNVCSFTVKGNVLTLDLWNGAITTPGEYALYIPAGVGITRASNGEAVEINGEITFTVEEPAAPFDWAGTYVFTGEPTSKDGSEYPVEFEVEVTFYEANEYQDAGYCITSFMGNDVNAINYGGIELTIADDGKSATLANGNLLSLGGGSFLKIFDANGAANPIAITLNEDGTLSMADFTVVMGAWGDNENNTQMAEYKNNTLVKGELSEPETPTLNETVIFDFVNNNWGIPTMEENNFSNIKTAGEYTDGKKTINIDPTANNGSYIYDSKGFLNISKPGSKIILPAFDFAVEKIEVVGHASGTSYQNVDMNVYVGETAVSTACFGTTATSTFEIAADNQAAGNVYELVIGSNAGNYSSVMYITYIKVYPAENKLEAPVIDLASGVYVGAQTVNVHSTTADIEGVTDVTYYYTTDGNEPTVEDEVAVNGEITIDSSCTLKVVVELTYGDKTYVSASSSAEYIITEEVTYHRAVAVESGSYFLVADGNVATPIEANGKSLPAKETTVNGDDVTEGAYYALTLEETENGFNIKDVNGKYIYTSMMYTDRVLSGTTPMDAWTITIAKGETSAATISGNGLVLVYNEGAFVVVPETAVPETAVYPTFYGIHTTGIENVITNGEAIESIYDLQGRKLEKINKGGIYIVNGKKVLVK